MQTPSFASSVAKNSGHACSLPHCSLRRHGLYLWCKDHALRARRYGHPSAGPLSTKLWAAERRMVADLFARNVTHKGQLQALEWVGGLVAQATHNVGAMKGGEELARLARHGIKSIDILTELCAVTAYLDANPRAAPDNRAWDYAVSSAVFKLAPRPRRITRTPGTPWGVTVKAGSGNSYAPKPRTSALAFVGRHLRQSLAPFIANVQRSIQSRDAQRKAFEAELSAPLSAF